MHISIQTPIRCEPSVSLLLRRLVHSSSMTGKWRLPLPFVYLSRHGSGRTVAPASSSLDPRFTRISSFSLALESPESSALPFFMLLLFLLPLLPLLTQRVRMAPLSMDAMVERDGTLSARRRSSCASGTSALPTEVPSTYSFPLSSCSAAGLSKPLCFAVYGFL